MNFTKEQIEKASKCKSVDELLELAKAEGIDLARAEAEKYFAQLSSGELNLDDMTSVAGGACAGNACAQC
ncbi:MULTISPECIES: hypothetical protein [unclassified Butyrivibrio]|uniref:hypothetical protein n=1 Tax=unclassified Butyrivibrio TaxID=2639466 RepID=UPI0003B70E70|nr:MULTISPECIES: hypothetical protein [unclassified Butyrivibrio]MBE5836780.1 hypothetical protein [Butyrivibrio sp.]MBP3817783.1 hypothetical protein [Butyrivibrio sp.]